MMKDTEIYELLVQSLDTELEPQEQKILELALQGRPEWRAKKEELLALRATLGSLHVAEQADFVDQVMLRVAKAKSRVIQLPQFVAQIAAACVLLVLSVLMSLYFSEGSLNTDVLLGIQDLSPEDAYTLLNY